MSSSAVSRGYLNLFGARPGSERPSAAEIRDVHRRNGRLERRLAELERRNRRLRRELDERRDQEVEAPYPGPCRAVDLGGLRRLSGALGHVFNNLMTCISCSSSLLRAQLPADFEGHEHLDHIDEAWQGAVDVCRRMSMAAGDAPLRTAELDLNELLRQVEPEISETLGERARLRLRFGAERVPITGDATLLRQLVLELAVNAVEAVGDGPGTVTISTGWHESAAGGDGSELPEPVAGPMATLEVADDGSGIEPDRIAEIFDPFFSTKFLGRGLGLTAAMNVVEQHCGTIRGSSRAGRGTTFQVILPAGY